MTKRQALLTLIAAFVGSQKLNFANDLDAAILIDLSKFDKIFLEVHHKGRVVKFTSDQIWDALNALR